MTISLLHFARRSKHAGHYLGIARDLDARLAEHAAGSGARLTQVVQDAGIDWVVARTWTGDRKRARQLKNQGSSARHCPVCRAARAARESRRSAGANCWPGSTLSTGEYTMKTREQVTLERIGYHVADFNAKDQAKGKPFGDRINKGARILTQGGVTRLGPYDYDVQSETSKGKAYHVNGACTCKDAGTILKGHCKHKFAVLFYRLVEQDLQELVKVGLPQRHHQYDCELHRDIPVDCWERACGDPLLIPCPTCGPRPGHTGTTDPFTPEQVRPEDEDARIALDEDLSDETEAQPATDVVVDPPEDPLPPLILETAQYEPAPVIKTDDIVPFLPEAAASLNIKVRMDQFELMYTMRGHTDPEVLERLPQVLATIERLMHAEVDHDESCLQRLAHAFFPRKRGAYGK